MDEETKVIARQAHANQTGYFRSLHEARLLDARAVIQTSLLINGAAATAILAFLSSLSQGAPARHIPKVFIWSLGLFGAGVFCAACMSVMAYMTNHRYAESIGAKKPTWEHPFVAETDDSIRHDVHAKVSHGFGYAFAALTLVFFLAGVIVAAVGFTRLH